MIRKIIFSVKVVALNQTLQQQSRGLTAGERNRRESLLGKIKRILKMPPALLTVLIGVGEGSNGMET